MARAARTRDGHELFAATTLTHAFIGDQSLQMVTSMADVFRWLPAKRKGWTSQLDQAYHDALFADDSADPFSFSYPGYVTIRRFADLVSPLLHPGDVAVDLGCGPGEITRELARRHPEVVFRGLDHSRVGVERARGYAARLRLSNTLRRAAMGSSPGATTSHLASPRASRHHARVWRTPEGACWVEDLGSTNGTWVDGQRAEKAWLSPGSLLVLGDETLRVS